MRMREIVDLVGSTSDPSFAVDGEDQIVAWNQAAEVFFGLTAGQALGKPCAIVVKGTDECGAFCTEDCTILQSARARRPVKNFDMQMMSATGPRWCNVSILAASESPTATPVTVHVVRPIDVQKRLELAVRDYVVQQTSVPVAHAAAMLQSPTPSRETDLTDREIEILRRVARGAKTASIAVDLHISPATVNNHVAHAMRKLNVRSRLEAVRRAEHAGLL